MEKDLEPAKTPQQRKRQRTPLRQGLPNGVLLDEKPQDRIHMKRKEDDIITLDIDKNSRPLDPKTRKQRLRTMSDRNAKQTRQHELATEKQNMFSIHRNGLFPDA